MGKALFPPRWVLWSYLGAWSFCRSGKCEGGVRQPPVAREGLFFDLYRVIISAFQCCEMGQNQLDQLIYWRWFWRYKFPPSFGWDLIFSEKHF